ncbi:hypothetical protein [Mesorhizobium sophorae]|uniref:hypothetical protein n=1 Tax=Mesorhizobium sophorae TaxID=1300294 RepID=UPI00142E4E7B|nr:hypothetical protein [Mesorhizobium sophorae]
MDYITLRNFMDAQQNQTGRISTGAAGGRHLPHKRRPARMKFRASLLVASPYLVSRLVMMLAMPVNVMIMVIVMMVIVVMVMVIVMMMRHSAMRHRCIRAARADDRHRQSKCNSKAEGGQGLFHEPFPFSLAGVGSGR